jgi:hypothetical protein
MRKLSDTIRSLPFRDFKFTGDFDKDVKNYIKKMETPLRMQNLDDNIYVTALYRLSFGKNITVHTLTDGVIEKIKHTKIENVPNKIPKFMKYPFLIEARHDKVLFDNIYSIGGFTIDNEICLLIGTRLGTEEGYYCQHEKASFDGRKIEDLNVVYHPHIINYGQNAIQLKNRKDTFVFVTILSLMLEAERTPLLIETKKGERNNKIHNRGNTNHETEWITKRIYIDKNIKYKNTSNDHSVLNKNGKDLKDVIVNGFLRRQHYGKDLLQTKWIYINSFDSKRWKNNKDTNIIVDIYGEK